MNLNGLRRINNSIIKKAVRNKVLNEGTIDGYTVAVIDGTRLFRTGKAHCADCLCTSNRGKQYYYHECSVMSLMRDNANLIIDYEMAKRKSIYKETSQSEIVTSRKLLNRVVAEHPSLIDIVVYYALACNSVFTKECQKLGIDAIVRVKKTTNLSLKEVKRVTNKTDRVLKFKENGYDIEVYESTFYMNDMEEPIRYIKYAKQKKDGDETERTQMLIITTCMNMKLELL